MPKHHSPSLQDPYLNTLRREKVVIAVYLINGIKLQGVIQAFDQFMILLKSKTTQLVYKHAISTIVPPETFSYYDNAAGQQMGDVDHHGDFE